MNNWKKVKLGQILTESKVEATNSDADSRIRVLLNANGVVKRPLTKETKGATKYFKRSRGQFIYGKQNLHKGAFGIIPKELDGFTSSSDLPAFDIDKSCLPEWLDYFFKQGDFYLSLIDIAKGAATKRIQPKTLYEIEMPLPDTIEEQSLIIKGIKKKEKQNLLLKNEIQTQKHLIFQLKQSILQEAIQGKLTQEWREQNSNIEPASELLKCIKAEKEKLIKAKKIKKEKPFPPITKEEISFEIPESWVWCRLGEVIVLQSGQDLTKREYNDKGKGIPYITGASHIVNEEIKVSRWTETPKSISIKNDLLLTCKGTIGKLTFNNIGQIHIARQIMAIRNISDIEIKYIKNFIKTYIVILLEKSKSLIPGISRSDVLSIEIPLPPLAEQKAIVEKVESLMEKCNALEQEVLKSEQHANMLMQAVLQEAFDR